MSPPISFSEMYSIFRQLYIARVGAFPIVEINEETVIILYIKGFGHKQYVKHNTTKENVYDAKKISSSRYVFSCDYVGRQSIPLRKCTGQPKGATSVQHEQLLLI